MRAAAFIFALIPASAVLSAESGGRPSLDDARGMAGAARAADACGHLYRGRRTRGPRAGECAVFFFGRGQGGSVEDNIERWRSQIVGPDGKPAVAKSRQAAGARLDDDARRFLRRLHGNGRPDGTGHACHPQLPAAGRSGRRPGRQQHLRQVHRPRGDRGGQPQAFEQLLASFQVDK